MSTVLILLTIGVLLLALEVILPGFIVGALGVAVMLLAIVIAYVKEGPGIAFLMFGVALVFIAVTFWVEFYWLPKTRWGRNVILNSAVRGNAQATSEADDLKGREGQTVTPLSPSGFVVVDGKRREAYSESGHLDSGTRVRVIGRGNFRLIVSKISSP